jgi:putative addiction module CopG family antidote
MAATTMNISLTPELRAGIETRLRSGQYGNASDVIRAGLRALAREELGASLKWFEEIMARLPGGPSITPETEQRIERAIRKQRAAEKGKKRP